MAEVINMRQKEFADVALGYYIEADQAATIAAGIR